MSEPTGWRTDPLGRHEWRYFVDGSATSYIADGDVVAQEKAPQAPSDPLTPSVGTGGSTIGPEAATPGRGLWASHSKSAFPQARLRQWFARHPWVAVVLWLAMIAVLAGNLAYDEVSLYPRGSSQVEDVLLGFVSFPVIVALATIAFGFLRGRGLAILVGALAAADAAVGLSLGLGWNRYSPNINPSTLPRDQQTFGAGVVAGVILFMVAVVVRFIVRTLASRRSDSLINSSRA